MPSSNRSSDPPPAPPPRSSCENPFSHAIRRRLQQFALLLATLLVCGLLLELGVRLIWEPPFHRIDQTKNESDPWPYTTRFKPSDRVFIPMPDIGGFHVDLNRHGFRGPDLETLAGRALRVVSIGDSFSFGWGVDFDQQCFVAFLDDYARARPALDLAHASLAEPGWGPRDYFFAYEQLARRVRPQLVIVGFFCGDDILPAGTIASLARGKAPSRPRLREASWLRLQSLDWVRFQVRGSPALTRLFLRLGVRPRSDLQRFLRDEPPALTDMWRETLTCLAALDAAVRRDGARLVIVSFPSIIQLYGHDALDDDVFDYRRVDRRLESFCAESGIPFVPLLPALIADGRPDLYFPIDRHPTPAGHAVCAAELARRLTPLLDEIAAAP